MSTHVRVLRIFGAIEDVSDYAYRFTMIPKPTWILNYKNENNIV